MAVHQLYQVRGSERQRSGEHLVEGDTKRIQSPGLVDRAVQAAGLRRCDVGQRAGDHLARFGGQVLARQAGGNAETGEPHFSARPIHQDMARLEVLVDEASLVDLGEGHGDADGEAQERSRLHRAAEEPGERFAPRVLEHQHGAPVLVYELQRPRCPPTIQFVLQSVFVRQAFQSARCRGLGGGHDGQHGGPAAVTAITPSSAEEEVTVLPQHLQVIHRSDCHTKIYSGCKTMIHSASVLCWSVVVSYYKPGCMSRVFCSGRAMRCRGEEARGTRLCAVHLIVLGGPRRWPPRRDLPDIPGPRRGSHGGSGMRSQSANALTKGSYSCRRRVNIASASGPSRSGTPACASIARSCVRSAADRRPDAAACGRVSRIWLRSAAVWRAMANANRARCVGAPSIPTRSRAATSRIVVSPASQDCSWCWER